MLNIENDNPPENIYSDLAYIETIEEKENNSQMDHDVSALKIIETTLELEEILDYTCDSVFEFSTNLYQDCKPDIDWILNSAGDDLIIGPMGSGKTTAIINSAIENRVKVILVVPLRINDEQLTERHSLKSRRDMASDDEIKQTLIDETFMVCVYDSLPKIYNALVELEDLNNWTIVIDEAHNFISQANFRYESLRRMRSLLADFKKRIYLTGTPEGLIHCLKSFSPNLHINYFKNISSDKEESGQLQLIYTTDSPAAILINHLITNPVEGLTVVAIDNIRLINALARKIQEFYGDVKVQVLSSEVKDGQVHGELVRKGMIDADTKYFFTTSIISDGCDINNENLSAVYSVNWKDLNKLRQFYSRFRMAGATVKYYDIWKSKGQTNNDLLIDVNETFNSWKQNLESLAVVLSNPILHKTNDDFKNHSSGDYFYYSGVDVKLDQFFCQYRIMQHLFSAMNSPVSRLKYFEIYSYLTDIKNPVLLKLNSEENRIIKGVVNTSEHGNIIIELYKQADQLCDNLKTIGDGRVKESSYTPQQAVLSELSSSPIASKLLKDFKYMNAIINIPDITVRLISYDTIIVKEIKQWLTAMDLYYRIKQKNQRAFPRDQKKDADIIRQIIKYYDKHHYLIVNDISNSRNSSKYLVKKWIYSIFNISQDPNLCVGSQLIVCSEKSLSDILPGNQLFLNDEKPIGLPSNAEIFRLT